MNVRNGARTLQAAIATVRAQTCSDWELIVWDDGSSDDSLSRAQAVDDVRIRCFQSPRPTHLGHARHQAIAKACGRWIAFLDQDDLWLPDKLQQQLQLVAPGVGLIYGRSLSFWESGRRRDFDRHHEHQDLPEGEIFDLLVQRSCFVCMSSALLLREAVLALPPWPEWVHVAPDYHLFLAVARWHAASAVQAPVCLYRVHSGGMTGASLGRIQQEALALLTLWQADIPPEVLRQRQRVHHTVLAYVELCSPGERLAGLRRLLRQGSPGFLLSRPWALGWRALRRRLWQPMWQKEMRQRGREMPVVPESAAP